MNYRGAARRVRLAYAQALATYDRPQTKSAHYLFAEGRGDSGGEETVRVQRRRRAAPSGPEGRERAEAPQRERPEVPSAPPPGGTGRPPAGGGGSGGGMRPPPPGGASLPGGGQLPIPGGCGGIGILVLIVLAFFLLPNLLNLGRQDTGVDQPPVQAPTQVAAPTTAQPVAAPTNTPATPGGAAGGVAGAVAGSSTGGQTWTVMLYQNADDQVLEKDIFVDLNEAERVGSTDRVHIVAQLDRYRGGFQGDGNWTGTRRYYVTRDDDLMSIGSELVADVGEVNMADPAALVDFAVWAIENYPADKYVLILSDHGMGWPGGWHDPDPGGPGIRSIPLANRLGNQLYLMEIDAALGEIRSRTGVDKLELVGMDACLMGHIEVFAALAPHARYAVASQEVEPALGWAYTSFLGALAANPDMSGAELSRQIVDSYIFEDQRIVDDQARAELVSRGQPLGGLFSLLGGTAAAPSAQQVANQMVQNVTLTAFDLDAMPELISSLNDFSYALQSANQQGVAKARSYAQSYTSIFGSQVPASYLDLGHFVQLLQQVGAPGDLGRASDRLLAAINQGVVAEVHGPQKPASTGVSIYFPISQLYRSPEAGPQSYTAIAGRFAAESLWDDFLAFHYTGRQFEPATNAVVVPDRSATVQAPGAGQIELSPITASATVAAPGRPILLNTQIRGENVGYVYLFAGFYDQAANSLYVADMDYLESAETRELNGIYYPVWPESSQFTLEFEWEPLVFGVSDGANREVALFRPQTYGAAPEDAVYTVDGIYTYANGEQRSAQLLFRDTVLHQVFAFTAEGQTGAPWEIIPESGDQFTILDQWMDLDQNGRVVNNTTQQGGTLTFSDQTFTLQELDAAAGDYVVGFIVEDLDGNQTSVYTRVAVE
jgi:hypothetical protein